MTTATRIRPRGLLPLLLCLVLTLAVGSAGAATITIVNNDGANEGFNDPTVVAPVGGNPMTTLGAQRLYIFQYAASIWGGMLSSAVPILVNAQFNPLTCDSVSATLGSTSTSTLRNTTNLPFTNTWYAQSLANAYAGSDLAPTTADMTTQFNSTLDGGTCLGHTVWYYGTDGNEGVNVELLPVILHEMCHGLGFMTTTNGSNGSYSSSSPSIYDYHLYDNATGLHWNQETATQRRTSAIAVNKLAWDGTAVSGYAPTFLAKRPEFLVNSPPGIAGEYTMVGAAFGAAITDVPVTADVCVVNDGAGTDTSDACEQPLVNAAQVAGKWAMINRGTCTFVVKSQAAQAAGAIGVIIVNNAAGLPPNPLGGSDPTIVIPVVGISQADGNMIKAALASGPVNVTVKKHPTALAGVDAAGRPLLYTPSTYASGSSVSHWDVTITPNALMEPFINSDLHTSVDLSLPLLQDIGWFALPTPTLLALFTAEGRADGILLRWEIGDPAGVGAITVQRAPGEAGPWAPIPTDLGREGTTTTALDTQAEPGKTYYYRLAIMDRSGDMEYVGLASAQRTSPFAGGVFMGSPAPNPSAHGFAVMFRIGRPEYVRLSIVDASGRVLRTLQEGMLLAGEYSRTWDGRTGHGGDAPAGVYFMSLRTSQGVQTQRVALVR